MNPYLVRRREQYDALKSSIEGIQERAAQENRDLDEAELTSVRAQAEQAKTLAAEITDLTEIENRNAAVASLAASIADAPEARSDNGAVRVGTTTAKDRDPGHYRRDGGHSFFGDLFAARSLQDETALRRLTEHNRALDMAGEGAGVVPPVWMSSEFAELARQGRRVASAVRNIPINSAAAISIPRQTTGVDAKVVEQGSENAAYDWDGSDAWASAVDTVTPKATTGGQIVSRQMLDSSNPAVDALIYGDLVASYSQKVEKKVVDAMVAAAGSAIATFASEATDYDTGRTDGDKSDDLVDLAMAVRQARKLPADVLIVAVSRYGQLLKLKDTTNRPLIPGDSGGPMNVIGTGSVAVDGRVHGLGVIATDGLSGGYPDNLLAARASDTILFESPTLRFRYEEPNGPESIRLGIWAYTACYVKYTGGSVKRIQITAA
jgi:HK97 family phage major capsid protein